MPQNAILKTEDNRYLWHNDDDEMDLTLELSRAIMFMDETLIHKDDIETWEEELGVKLRITPVVTMEKEKFNELMKIRRAF